MRNHARDTTLYRINAVERADIGCVIRSERDRFTGQVIHR